MNRLPAVFMRGGTGKALMFHLRDLPADRATWDALFLKAVGSPDPHGRQLKGMGGGVSSLSKVCVLGPPTRPDADLDYTFAQILVNEARVDYSGNCGNISSAAGPFAVEEGVVPGTLRLAMPSGVLTVGGEVIREAGAWRAVRGSFYRTTRRLFEGYVYA